MTYLEQQKYTECLVICLQSGKFFFRIACSVFNKHNLTVKYGKKNALFISASYEKFNSRLKLQKLYNSGKRDLYFAKILSNFLFHKRNENMSIRYTRNTMKFYRLSPICGKYVDLFTHIWLIQCVCQHDCVRLHKN